MSADLHSSPAADDRAVISRRAVDLSVSVLLFLVALALAYDNWQVGIAWAPDGPEAGYFPFYLCMIMAAASLVGVARSLTDASGRDGFVTRGQARRVMQVFVPTLVFVALIQVLGIYVASFILVSGFMIWLGKAPVWKALLTAAIFTAFMFYVFDVQFTVLMPKGPLEAAFGL
ncbi:tripartite tricarboxylate transporter TctB family protein [Roseixanthobacter glucoisosaccharinicivorans]|uniref:tripartite tricarboxylate transporter TctB family protein n=1 Tax=Roseixanthobacter glucoisosaccharinicivorans TaxID=3119923 RepID=UPI00372936D6